MKLKISSLTSHYLVTLTFLTTTTVLSIEQPRSQEAKVNLITPFRGAEKVHHIQQQVKQHEQDDSARRVQQEDPDERQKNRLKNTWIERILFQVEALNLNRRQHIQGEAQVAERLHMKKADSGLNRVAVIATDQLETEPEVARDEPLGLAATESAEDSLELVQTSTNAGGFSVNNEDEQRIVESNNVSAIVQSSQSAPDNNQHDNNIIAQLSPTFKQPATTLGPNLQLATPQRPSMSCEQAYTQCALREACAPALRAYNDNCRDLFANRTNICSPKCLRAMIALRSTEEGDDLVNCDCMNNDYCLQSKQRSKTCKPEVDEALKPNTIVSCSTASWICLADQSCKKSLEYYYLNCQIDLFQQRQCSMRCNNSLSILNQQRKASKLMNCFCDGTEDFACLKYKTYTERLCLNKPAQSDQFIDFNLDTNQQTLSPIQLDSSDGIVTEEDSINMTGDPETFIMGPVACGSGCRGGIGSDQNLESSSTNEDSKVSPAAGIADPNTTDSTDEESSSTTFNGIQLVNNNWIPLVGGRYFANLQHQKRAQRQQQHLMARQQSHQSSKYHENLPQAQFQTSQKDSPDQQGHLRSVKQKSYRSNNINNSYYDTRKRQARLFSFSSSSTSSIHNLRDAWLFKLATWFVILKTYQMVSR